METYAPHVDRGPILVTNFTTRDPDLAVRIPYWICDFLYMGRTDDLRFVFDAPLYSPSDFTYACATNKFSSYCPDVVSIFPPEVYLGLRLLRLFRPDVHQPMNLHETELMSRRVFWDLLIDHLLLVDLSGGGVRSIKYPLPFANYSVMVSRGKLRAMRAIRDSLIERPGRALIKWFYRTTYIAHRVAKQLLEEVRSWFVA